MKISIAHDKKIIKREKKEVKSAKTETVSKAKIQNKSKKAAAKNGIATLAAVEEVPEVTISTEEVETNVLAIGDYGVFKVNSIDGVKTIEGRIIEISDESSNDAKVLIFRMDVSTEYNSALTDIISLDAINWTKSGEETISIEDLLKYSYEDDKSLTVDTGTSVIAVRVNDIVTVTNSRTGETKKGRVASILNNQVTIDCSSRGYSDVYVIDSYDIENDNISIVVEQQ